MVRVAGLELIGAANEATENHPVHDVLDGVNADAGSVGKLDEAGFDAVAVQAQQLDVHADEVHVSSFRSGKVRTESAVLLLRIGEPTQGEKLMW